MVRGVQGLALLWLPAPKVAQGCLPVSKQFLDPQVKCGTAADVLLFGGGSRAVGGDKTGPKDPGLLRNPE